MTKADEEKARVTNAAFRSWSEGYRRVQEFWGKPWRLPFTDAEIREAELSAAISQARAEAYADAARVARSTANFDDDLQRSGGGVPCGERIARAIEAKAKEVG